MATNSKQAAKPTKNEKPLSGTKTATSEPKAMAKKSTAEIPENTETPAKKATAKKEAAPVKKSVEKADIKAETPVKKANTPKAEAAQPAAADKEVKPAAKKAAVAKTEEPKTEPMTKKEEPKKAIKKTETPPVAVKEEAAKPIAVKPAAKKEKEAASEDAPAPAPHRAPEPRKAVKKEAPRPIPVKPMPVAPRPMPTPATRTTEKKPQVVIAHRRMENKSKVAPDPANTMISYLPETYRSILDEPQQHHGPVFRYSDEDLNEFREIITSRIDAARKELNYLQGLITRKDEAGTEDTENRYMNMEDGSGAMEREQLAQLASRQIQFMGHLEKALVRIENKTYGICRVTGKLIDKARLRAVPHATLSIEAKNTMSSKNG